MKTPSFWHSSNIGSSLLIPFSLLYDAGRKAHRRRVIPTTLPVPVICIGNLTAGGTGKTPVALHIGRYLKQKRIAAFFLSRGYGGKLQGPLLVDVNQHRAHEVGDEPLLLARLLPTVVAKNRLLGAQFALSAGAEVIIMDDGFQNPSLTKTLSLLVVDGVRGFGNGRLLPAGPLREPVEEGLKRAQAAIIIGNPSFNLPVASLHAHIQPLDTERWRGKEVIAFCGIGYPQKFFDTLAALGASLAETVSFADHYAYTDSDIAPLIERAARRHAILVTTSKDAVRLPEALKATIGVLDIGLTFDKEDDLHRLIDRALLYGKS